MTLPQHLAAQIRAAYFGPNWTERNLRDLLRDVSRVPALTRVKDLHTIAALVYHIHYYTRAQLRVLEGGPLEASDRLAFAHPPIESAEDWQQLLATTWLEAERYAEHLAALAPDRLTDMFVEEKYGSYYANVQGNLEHVYYHTGQIALLKKLLHLPATAK